METMNSIVWAVSRSFLQAKNVHEVFDAITSGVQTLVPQADMVILYTYDAAQRVLRLGSGVGVVHSSLKHIAFLPGESMTGEVFVSKKPILCKNKQDVKKNMATISDDNLRWYRQGTNEKEVRYSFSVPLLVGDRCLGTLAVNGYQVGSSLCQKDVDTVIQLSAHGALALERAQYLEQEALHLKHYQQEKVVQSAFMKILLEGGDVERVLIVLHRIVNHAFTTVILNEKNNSPFLYPISTLDEFYGWLSLSQPPTAEQEALVKQAAQTVAIILSYESRNEELELQEKEDLFTELLETDSLKGRRQLFLSHASSSDVKVLCFSLKDTSSYKQIQRVISSVTSEYTIIRYDSNWYVYVESGEDGIVEALQTNGSFPIGISSSRHIEQFSLLFNEATEAFHHAEGISTVYYEHLGHKRLWSRLPEWQKQEFVNDYLSQLFLMDPVYEKTLAAFINYNRDRKKTAENLYIHPNTLYQRLKKMEQTLGVSFDLDYDWINIVLAFSMK